MDSSCTYPSLHDSTPICGFTLEEPLVGLAFVGVLVGGAVLALVDGGRCATLGSSDFRRFEGGVLITGVCSSSGRFLLLLDRALMFTRGGFATTRSCFGAVVTGDSCSHDGRNCAGVNSCRYFR
jgi:hypothetical protein